jgi:hypothetical protein
MEERYIFNAHASLFHNLNQRHGLLSNVMRVTGRR